MSKSTMTEEEKAVKAKEQEEAIKAEKAKEEKIEELLKKYEDKEELKKLIKSQAELEDRGSVIWFRSTAAKKKFVKKCDEMKIEPDTALELIVKGFLEDKFELKSKTEWYI